MVMLRCIRVTGAGMARASSLGLAGLCFIVTTVPAKAETGIISHYSSLSVTASGRSYSTGDAVAAHKTLPLGSIVRIENTRNGRSAMARSVCAQCSPPIR